MKYYERIEIYAKKNEKAKIERIAHRAGKSVSRYMVESALGKSVERD